jgi:hypothetical protein
MKETLRVSKKKDRDGKKSAQEHFGSEAWPEQRSHKHVTLQHSETNEIIYVTQKDKGQKILQLLQKSWEIITRID